MTQTFFVGVDGGATKCIVRVEDEQGNVLGREISGSANINISVTQAWQSIFLALEKIIKPLAISLEGNRWHVGMGMAGCEVKQAYHEFLNQPHPFETLKVSSDAHIACLGAHNGKDGSIIIIGTGAVGLQVELGQTHKVGGWGFPHDDQGGGAWLGLEAVKVTLQALDKRRPFSGLALEVYNFFHKNLDDLVTWANQANSTAFAELAPLVIKQSQTKDGVAIQVMQEAAKSIDNISFALEAARLNPSHPLPCSLIGGIASFMQPFLNDKLRGRLMPCKLTPDAGAILLVKNYLSSYKSNTEAAND